MTRISGKAVPHGDVELRDLVERIRRVNPTGRVRRASEEQARYAEKARLQSLLIEDYPDVVRVQAHDDMPGIVSLSLPHLRASAAHAVVEALSDRARGWVEEQIRAALSESDRGLPAGRRGGRPPARGESRLTRAAQLVSEYDFECAERELTSIATDTTAPGDERTRALMALLLLHVDYLANDCAALALRPALQALGPLSPKAHELLGIAAARSGEVPMALHHLPKGQSERAVPFLISLARDSVERRDWAAAGDAWAHLQTLLMTTEPAFASSAARLRDEARRHFEQCASQAQPHELLADEALVRFVREFAPAHPWLRKRRESAQQARTRASVRAAIERAQGMALDGDRAGVEQALGWLARSAAGRAEPTQIEALTAWAEEQRTQAQAARTLALAAAGDAESACRSYLALSERARERVGAVGLPLLFAAFEALNAALPEKAGTRALTRAAAAWSAAHRALPEPDCWCLLAPHAAVLASVPAFDTEVQRLRARAKTLLAPTTGASSQPPAGSREVRIDALCFTDQAGASSRTAETIDVGPCALRVGAMSYVVTLEALGEADSWQVSLRPIGGQAPRCIRIEGPARFRAGCLLTTSQRAALVDESGVLWRLVLAPKLTVERVDLGASGGNDGSDVVAVNGDVVALGRRATGSPPDTWRLVDTKTGAAMAELKGPRIHRTRTAQGSIFHRVSGALVERLDAAGEAVSQFELPCNVSPSRIVESPFPSLPVLLSATSSDTSTLVWWQAERRFFRAFELFDEKAHGVAIDAVALLGRALYVVTRRACGAAFLHVAQTRKSTFLQGSCTIEQPGHLGLVVDAAGRRGWSVRRGADHGVEICPLHLGDDHP